ncbi:MAG TPA: bacillithiol biosynthesis cysteine-adding enzyme BshC [Candidatus Acidoferrales bacterium]|nr:bacillithiol biosynthesis cysteine-adding enzyme BshC [Candidatus Acidoferrales bacterium]
MECDCLRFSEIPQTTKLFASFTDDFSKVERFYAHKPDDAGVRSAAKEARLDTGIRRAVSEILREQNERLGSSLESMRNIERLRDGAAAIVTGQQVGLFGGPAYCFYKALDAIAWAKRLTRAGVDAVPIFWMATEDHDLAEANHVFFHERYGIAHLAAELDDSVAGQSVGKISFGNEIAAVVEHASTLLDGPSAKEVREAVAASYRAGENFGSAFDKLLARLLAGGGLILLDPLDRRLHELARPIYRNAIQQAGEIAGELLARGKELGKRGFHAQVKVTQQSTLIFLDVQGKREAVRRKNGDFLARDLRLSGAELLKKVENEPEALSAGVLLRPILQDFLLPTAAYIGGPAEVAYMAQAQVVYKRILGRMPAILPRASFTLVEPNVTRTMKKYELSIANIFAGRQQLRRKMEMHYLPRGLEARFARDEKALRKLLSGYAKPISTLDKSLGGARDTAEKKILYQFQKLRGKAGRAQNERTGVLDRHESEILSSLYPHRGLQERTLSLLPFLARYGTALLERLESATQSPCKGHRIVTV